MIRLSTTTGGVADNSPQAGDSDDSIKRPAILVHTGSFQSGDGPIEFDDARIKNVVEKHNQKILTLAEGYGGVDKMPVGAFPPILDQHGDDSNNRIVGRLASLLRFERRDVPGVGKNIACAVADITFLGKDTVNKVKDGRIYHLSIGIDEATDTLGETSTVIEPAAPGAMLLSRGSNKTTKGTKMSDQLKRMKSHTERLAKLSAMKTELSKGTNELKKSTETLRLAKREASVSTRLTKLMQEKKLTPAEFKNMSSKITRLAKLDDEGLDTALMVFEARERPVIEAGQRGSTDAAIFSDIGKALEKRQMKNLSRETRADLMRLSGGKLKLKGEDEGDYAEDKKMSGPKEEIVHPGKDEHSVPGQEHEVEMSHEDAEKLGMMHEKLGKHLAEGDIDGAKACHMEIMKHCEEKGYGAMKHMAVGDVKSEDQMKSMDEIQKNVDELSTQLARMAGMVDELMSAEKEEGHDLEAAGKE